MRSGGRGLASVAAFVTAFLAINLSTGCVHAPRPGEPSPSYFQDAGKCGRQSQNVTKVRARAGAFRGDLPLELGLNRQKYQACMESLGWMAPDPAEDPYFALTAKCRQSATRSTQNVEGGGLRLHSAVDETAYRDCMRSGGAEGEVIVHPFEAE